MINKWQFLQRDNNNIRRFSENASLSNEYDIVEGL